MISLHDIVGQAHAVESLRRTLATSRIPQAMLLQGPEAVGKATTARAFAAALLCESPTPEACGRCSACHLLDRGGHPDVLTIQREPKKTARARAGESADDEAGESTPSGADDRELSSLIVVPQIREMNRLAGFAPRLGRRRVFIIDPADRMNLEAQNSLLKTLEEPPGATVVILIASRPHVLLPTVRSRCFTLGFSALRTEELEQLLERRGIEAGEAATRAALSEGRPGLALGLDLDGMRERREDVLGMLEGLAGPRPDIEELPRMASALAGDEEAVLVEGLELLEGLVRDAARLATGSAPSVLVHRDLEPRLARIGDRLGGARAAELIAGIERVRGYLRTNANRTLSAEAVLASIAGAPLP